MKVLILRAMLSRADILLLDEVRTYVHDRKRARGRTTLTPT